jgi:hypothetical protein
MDIFKFTNQRGQHGGTADRFTALFSGDSWQQAKIRV